MTSPHDLSDGEVEESISSRLVEVDEMDLNVEDPSPPSSSNEYLRSSSSLLPLHSDSLEKKEYEEEKDDYEDDFEVVFCLSQLFCWIYKLMFVLWDVLKF